MGPLFLVLDVGTSSCKAAAIDTKGKKISEFSSKYPTNYPQPSYAEQNPEDWIRALSRAILQVTTNLGDDSKRISGISISAHGPTLILIDVFGKPMKPAQIWQDFRCVDQGDRLIGELRNRSWIGLGGTRTGMAAKILWVKENWPETFDKCKWIFGVKEFIIHWLTGEVASEPSSGPESRIWPVDVFDYIGLPLDKLPKVFPSIHHIADLKLEISKEFKLPRNLPVYMGLNDGASSTLGTGAFRPGDACVSLGTNGVGRLVLDRPFDSNLGMELSAFFWPYIPECWVVGGMTVAGGSCLSWIKNAMGNLKYEKIGKLVESTKAGCNGAIFLPFLNGRGTPHHNEKAHAAFLNLTINNSQGDLLRSVMEGVAFSIRDIYEAFQKVGFGTEDIRITGGGAQFQVWRKIISNVLSRKVIYAGGDATLGGAVLAAVASGVYSDFNEAISSMVSKIDEIYPDKCEVDLYDDIYLTYKTLIEQLDF